MLEQDVLLNLGKRKFTVWQKLFSLSSLRRLRILITTGTCHAESAKGALKTEK